MPFRPELNYFFLYLKKYLEEVARDLLKQFNLDSGFTHDQVSRDEFHGRLVLAAETTGIPHLEDRVGLAGFLLPKILQDLTDLNVIQRVTAWLQKRGDGPAPPHLN